MIAIAEPRVEPGAMVVQRKLPPPDALEELASEPAPDPLEPLLPLVPLLPLLPTAAPPAAAPPAPVAVDVDVDDMVFVSAVSPHPPLIAAAPAAIAAIQPKWRSAEPPVEALLPKLIMQALFREAIQCCSVLGSPAGPSDGAARQGTRVQATLKRFQCYRLGVDRYRHHGRTGASRAAAIAAPIALALLAVAPPARAGAFEVAGFGPEGIAAINARAARADDGTAAFYNPGGLGLGRGTRLSIAPTVGVSTLSADGKTLPLSDPFGVALSFATTIPLSGPLHDRIRVGFGGYFLSTGVLHLLAPPIDQPVFPYYDNRTQRLVLLPALAVRLAEGLAVGASVNVLGGVTGPAAVRPGASGAPESRLDLAANATAALHLGLRVDLTERVRLALAFRQRFAVPALITTTSEISGVPLSVTVKADGALADPASLVLGSSFDLGPATVEIDAAVALWSAVGSPYVFVRAELPGLNLASDLPEGITRDVVSLRAAAAYRFDPSPRVELTLQGGAGFEPTMLKSAPQGRARLLDGDKALLGLGASLALRDLGARAAEGPWLGALRFGAGLGAQIVLPRGQESPRLRGRGAFWSTSLGVGVDL